MAAFALPVIGGLSSILGGFLGSGAAKQAAGIEAGTYGRNSEQLAQVGEQQLQQELGRLHPYVQGGQGAFNSLISQLTGPKASLTTPYQSFQAPTGLNYQNDPGYQARMQMGADALQNSAAARGDLLSGNTLKALTDYGQTFGSNEYQNVYNRALQNYLTNAQNYYTGQGNTFNRLMGTAGMGLNASQLAQNANQAYQGLYGNAMGMSNQGAEAQAAGIMGSANAWQNALGGLGNAAQFYSMMNMLGNGGGFGAPVSGLNLGGGADMSPGVLSSIMGL